MNTATGRAGASYSIGDLAGEFGVTTRSIRFYEDRGLLQPVRRGQQRIFSEGQRVRLMLILRGKRMGFSLEECRQLIDLYDPGSGNRLQLQKLRAKIAERRAELAQKLQDIQTTQRELDEAEQRCQAALDALPPEKGSEPLIVSNDEKGV